MSKHNLELLAEAARLLKPLLGELVFVGGSTTALLITDKAAAEVRPTYDVDAIERRSARCANGRVDVGRETPLSVPKSGRLGICLAAHERPTAVLAWNVVAILWEAGFAACQGDEASFVSHLSAHLWDALERERREFPRSCRNCCAMRV
jgi:hypothetical protein